MYCPPLNNESSISIAQIPYSSRILEIKKPTITPYYIDKTRYIEKYFFISQVCKLQNLLKV